MADIKVGEIDGKKLYAYPKDAPDKMTWDEAKEYAKKLGGEWKLPNKEELELLYTYDNNGGGKKRGNFNNSSFYWSSSEFANNSAYVLDFGVGIWDFDFYKDYTNSVRCVRVAD